MVQRIAWWALAGVAVAVVWAIYAITPGFTRGTEFGRGMWALAQITCPIAVLGKHVPLALSWAVIINAFTYALLGTFIELVRRGSATAPKLT